MPLTTKIDNLKATTTSEELPVQVTTPGAPKRITVLAYGAPGAGKTYFASTFPTPLFLDMRGGMMAVRHKKVAFYQPRTFADMMLASIASRVQKYETIVLDHLTEATRLLMGEALRVADHAMPQLQDWGLVIERLRKLVARYTDDDALPDKHIVFIAEEQIDKDEELGKVLVTPDVPGKFARQIGSWFDCVFHLRNAFNPETKERGRYLLTEPDALYPAKDRTGCLSKLEVPDFNTMWKKITKEVIT